MDNATHTLFGLVLAETGLENVTPLATTTLIISSNLPDIDFVMNLRGGSLAYIKYHRGLTHTFIGIAVLAVLLTVVLVLLDRRLRLKGDPFRRPARPWRLFGLALVGGLGHLLLDFTNAYGVRPLLPFSNRWFYGDLIFIADPWIWLILGGAAVWITLRKASQNQSFGLAVFLWLLVGTGAGAAMALALKNGSEYNPAIPQVARIVWFCGLAVIVFGAMIGWGKNGERTARRALLLLTVYYGVMLFGRQAAILDARAHAPTAGITQLAAWPEPANPILWETVGWSGGHVDSKDVNVLPPWLDPATNDDWRQSDSLDQKLRDALDETDAGRTFLSFARFPRASVENIPNGYRVTVSDSRFSLRLKAELDTNFNVQWASVSWF